MTFLHGREVALFAFHKTLIDEHVPNRVRTLCSLANPVSDAVLFEDERGWVGVRVIGPEDFESLSPWVTVFLHDHKAIHGLLFLPDTGEANG